MTVIKSFQNVTSARTLIVNLKILLKVALCMHKEKMKQYHNTDEYTKNLNTIEGVLTQKEYDFVMEQCSNYHPGHGIFRVRPTKKQAEWLLDIYNNLFKYVSLFARQKVQ